MSRRPAALWLLAALSAQLLCPASGQAAPAAQAAPPARTAPPAQAAPSPRAAQSARRMAEATAAFSELRYDEALRLLDEVWRQGGSDPRQLRQIFELAGRAAAVIGEAAAARLWFARWLSLEPGAALPEGTSPKLTQLLDEARARLGGVPLDARASRPAGSDETAVELRADPAALVAAVRAGPTRAPIEAGRILTSAPEVELLDRYGNVVAVIAVVDVVAPGAAGSPGAADAADATRSSRSPRSSGSSGSSRSSSSSGSSAAAAPSRPWAARWTTWAVAAGVTATGGGVALFLAARADARLDELARESAEHDFAEVAAEERSLERAQWIARVGLGAAVASAALAAVLYLRDDEPGPALSASPQGVALSWEMSF